MRESPIAREGLKLIVPSLFLSVLLFAFHLPVAGAVVLAFCLFCIYFFRNPQRIASAPEDMLVSPADGRIMVIDEVAEREFINDTVMRIGIFMSPADVHVNRAPCAGRVANVLHRRGEFALAFKKDIDKDNERNFILIEREKERFLVVQIAGFLARRIISYVKEGDSVRRGDTLGMIAFGSRVDIYFPKNFRIMVNLNGKVKAGLTPLAQKKGEQ